MAVLIDHQAISLPAGTRTAEAAVSGGQRIACHIARQTTATPTFWSAGVSISLDIEVSYDGGATWRDACGFTADGGIVGGKNGGEATESAVTCDLPAGVNRARVTLVITGGTLVSQLTVESL